MGTRADFYVGRGATAEWLGSIAFDGYPSGIADNVLHATTEARYRAAVDDFLTAEASHATRPSEGWPWPWKDSRTTDYAYAFDGRRVWGSCFGYAWFDATQPEPDLPDDAEKVAVFPTMETDRFKAPGSRGSGTILVSFTPNGATVRSEEVE